MIWFIFMFLVFSQTLNSNLHVEVLCLLICFSLLPKVCFSFVFVFCLCVFRFFFILKKSQVLSEELEHVSFHSTSHFMQEHHFIPFPSFHVTTLHISFFTCDYMYFHPSSARTCNLILHFHFHRSHSMRPIA